MTDLRTAAQQALEALEYGQHSLKQVSEHQWESRGELAMQALRAALAQQTEPVASLNAWAEARLARHGIPMPDDENPSF